MSVRLRVAAGACIAAIFLLLTGPAFADCNADTALFEDDFEFLDPSWGGVDEDLFVEDGALIIFTKGWRGQVNFLTEAPEADVCVEAQTIDGGSDLNNTYTGIVFWWKDWDNYYMALTFPDGVVGVLRYRNGKDEKVFGSEDTAGFNKGAGQTNNLELQVRGKTASLFVNGTKLTQLKGVPPKGGGVFGLKAACQEGPCKFAFDNFIVSEPASEAGQ